MTPHSRTKIIGLAVLALACTQPGEPDDVQDAETVDSETTTLAMPSPSEPSEPTDTETVHPRLVLRLQQQDWQGAELHARKRGQLHRLHARVVRAGPRWHAERLRSQVRQCRVVLRLLRAATHRVLANSRDRVFVPVVSRRLARLREQVPVRGLLRLHYQDLLALRRSRL
jgi:hypothetical protein